MKKKSAILPYRFNNKVLEVLLVKNNSNTKWVIPKGTIETPLQPVFSATKEAYEEAGVLGIPHPIMIGTYHKNEQAVPTFLLEVKVELSSYDEGKVRERRWHKPAEITNFVVDEDLGKLIAKGVKIIEKNGHYFKYSIANFCLENKLNYSKIGKKKAIINYSISKEEVMKINIQRNKNQVEFIVPSAISFDSLELVPDGLAKKVLFANADHLPGSWAIQENNEQFNLFLTHIENLKALNSELFLDTIKKLSHSCYNFQKNYQSDYKK